MSEIQRIAEEMTLAICKQKDAHLFESIIALFNQGVLVYYETAPRGRFRVYEQNFKKDIEWAASVRFEGRERLIEALNTIKELEKTIESLNEQLKEKDMWFNRCVEALHNDNKELKKEIEELKNSRI